MPNQIQTIFPRISRAIDEIRGGIYTHIDAAQQELAEKGYLPRRLNLNKGIVRGLIELFSWGLWQAYNFMEGLLKQAVPLYSTGEWLDLHADSVSLTRKQATKASGKARFFRAVGASGNIVIAAGRIVRTLPDGAGEIYRYVTIEQAVLPAESDYVEIVVEAEEYGAGSNVSAGQICELVTPVTGISAVSNTVEWLISEGANVESDDSLAERYRLRWMSNNGCTKYAYMAWALSVPGVSSVEILDKHPRGQGTVGVVVRGAATLPTEALLERVAEAIAPQAPINDRWYVVSPEAVSVEIFGRLHYVKGDPELLKSLAAQRIYALFAEEIKIAGITPLKIGQDVTLSLLTAIIMGVTGIKSVEWLQPAGNVIVVKSGIAVLETLEFEAVTEEEE